MQRFWDGFNFSFVQKFEMHPKSDENFLLALVITERNWNKKMRAEFIVHISPLIFQSLKIYFKQL